MVRLVTIEFTTATFLLFCKSILIAPIVLIIALLNLKYMSKRTILPFWFIRSSSSSRLWPSFFILRLSRDDHDVSREPKRSKILNSMSYIQHATGSNLDTFELKQLVVFSFLVYQQYQHMSGKQSSWRDQVTLLSLLPLHNLNNQSVNRVMKISHTYNSPKSKNIFAFVTNLTDFESFNIKHDRDMS